MHLSLHALYVLLNDPCRGNALDQGLVAADHHQVAQYLRAELVATGAHREAGV